MFPPRRHRRPTQLRKEFNRRLVDKKLFGVVAWAHGRERRMYPFVYTLSGKGAERWVPLSGSNKSTFTSGKLVKAASMRGRTSAQFKPPLPQPNGGMAIDRIPNRRNGDQLDLPGRLRYQSIGSVHANAPWLES